MTPEDGKPETENSVTHADMVPPDILPETDDEIEASRAPLMSHLVELRQRLIWSFVALAVGFIFCFIFSEQLFNVLIIPYVDAVRDAGIQEAATLFFAPLEYFFTRVKLSFMAGFALAFPFIANQVYQFVAPGLYANEKKAVLPFLLSMPLLFTAGAALVFFLIMPFVMSFAIGMEQSAGEGTGAAIELFTKVGEYLSLISTLIMAFGFAFQLPVILTLLAMAGLIDDTFLIKNRRFAIVGIFLVAAVLTPPDPISQIALGMTIWGLYEVSIWCVRLASKRSDKAEEEPSTA